jgi:hypothetical protein
MDAFARAWDAEMSFIINNNYGNMALMIPARSICLNNNDVVVDIGAAIRRREFAEYMVRFNIDWSNPPYFQEEETLTFIAETHFSLVSVHYTVDDWEGRVVRNLIERVDELATDPDTYQWIREAVREETSEEDISREMVRIVEIAARRALERVINDNFEDLNRRSRMTAIERLDHSMSVSVRSGPDVAAVEAYQSVGGNLWNNIATMQIGDSRGIFTSQPGHFVFIGRVINIPHIEQVEGGQVARGIVGQYGLDDFLGRGHIDIHQQATRSQLLNSVARMTGAPRGADAVQWLRGEGIDVTAAGMNNPIQNQAALHLIMLVYEAQTGTRMDSLQITNFTVINNMPNLDQRYSTAVAAAVQLGLVDANIQPNAPLTIGNLLEILASLDALVGLR